MKIMELTRGRFGMEPPRIRPASESSNPSWAVTGSCNMRCSGNVTFVAANSANMVPKVLQEVDHLLGLGQKDWAQHHRQGQKWLFTSGEDRVRVRVSSRRKLEMPPGVAGLVGPAPTGCTRLTLSCAPAPNGVKGGVPSMPGIAKATSVQAL